MRSLALDVHQSFCEVAICERGKVRSAGRVKSERAALELFAESLDPTDQVVMEATGPAMEIARIIKPHVARVVVANAQDVRAISHARVKSDRFDARTLARLLDADMLEAYGCLTKPRRNCGAGWQGGRRWFVSALGPKRDPRRPRSLPARALAGLRPLRQGRAGLARPPGPPGRGGSRRLPVACARSTSWAGRSRRLTRSSASGCVSSPEAKRLMTHPRRRRRRRGRADGGDRRHLALLLSAHARRLPRPRRQGPPVRGEPGAARADLQAGQRTGTRGAGRGCLDRRPLSGSLSGLCRAPSHPQALRGRRRRRSPARSPVFAGSCSQRKRTTPSGDPPWCARSCAGQS